MEDSLCDMDVLAENTTTELSRFIERLIGDTQTLAWEALLETKWEQEVRECLETGKFWFISQGIFDKNGILQKTELLARLQGRDGTIFPDVFLPIIEAIGYKTVFDYLVIEKAFEGIARANPSVPCAININPTTFENDRYLLAYIDVLQRRYNIDPTRVILEILETEPVYDYMSFNRVLSELRIRWYKIAVDDFHPVGNHNIFCVDNLYEIDTVKFDGAYMCDLYAHRDEESVTQEFLATLHDIIDRHPNVDIVVEKIENQEMFEFFRDLFINFENISFQGYYFDRGSVF